MEKNINLSLREFSNDVASKKTMPGGGSVCAYSLSLGNSLASMVGNFTTGKKKYQEYEEDIQSLLNRTKNLSAEILSLVDEDCEAFLPLADAYKMPENTEEEKKAKEVVMQNCLKKAANVPFKLLRYCEEVLYLHEQLLEKGSKMLISDVGVGVLMVKSAALGAKLNVLINIKWINDIDFVEKINSEMKKMINNIIEKSDYIYDKVEESLK